MPGRFAATVVVLEAKDLHKQERYDRLRFHIDRPHFEFCLIDGNLRGWRRVPILIWKICLEICLPCSNRRVFLGCLDPLRYSRTVLRQEPPHQRRSQVLP